ncbi:MAG: DUF1080 domain-containing protein [Bacteroidetes bacterium]|nr:DUF1080 domain-containing protein [Bacteroidota bacterium]
MKKLTRANINQITCLLILFSISCSQQKQAGEVTSTTPEPEPEWVTLFDGQTLNGWKRYNADEIGSLWNVEDGIIACFSEGGGEASSSGGSLITVKQYGNFELSLEFKLSPDGNSGIMYHIVESDSFPYAYSTGPEYQLADDGTDAYSSESNKITAANYDMHPASADKKLNPVGEWNTAGIVYNNGHVEHWLNGEKVLEFEEGGEDWNSRYNKSKWVEYPGWNQFKKGSIGIQDHGNYTWFKNIRIREL